LSEHLTQNQIEAYGRHKLSAAELFSVSNHMDICDECSRQVERSLHGDTAFFALKSEVFGGEEVLSSLAGRAHLTPEQTAGYVDELLTNEEMQIVRDHLTGCEQCKMAVNDLRAFRDRIAHDFNHEYQPSSVVTKERWGRFVAYLSSFLPRHRALVFGSTLATLMLILVGWLFLQALHRKEMEKTETPRSPTTPAVTHRPVDSATPELGVEPPKMIAQLNDDGGQVTLDREGNLSGIDNLTPAYQRMIEGALINQRLEKSQLLTGLTRPGESQIRGRDNQDREFSTITPIRAVILSDRPTFRWSLLDGAASYVVEVYDDEFILVAASSQLTENSWTAPKSLPRGKIYSWLVKAIKDGQEFMSPRPPAPEAKFRILDRARANELRRAQRIYAGSQLMLGLLYARYGLLDEAELEFRKLREANPSSGIARQLLVQVQAMRD
jgi:anti-sigma factor RsiW